LKSKTGLADVLATLGSNPLPDSYVLRLPGFENAMDAGRVDDIAQQLKQQPGVDTVQIDSEWVKRLAALLRILRLVLLFLGITLGAVVVAVVFNTIRLQVMTQRDEIEVSRLFGATNSFIYRPFYYTGALLGLCAGLVALGLVVAAQQPLNTAILDLPTCMPRNSSWPCPAPWPSPPAGGERPAGPVRGDAVGAQAVGAQGLKVAARLTTKPAMAGFGLSGKKFHRSGSPATIYPRPNDSLLVSPRFF
jgi:hypothetical protein